jgi:hypothetical protein
LFVAIRIELCRIHGINIDFQLSEI